MKPLLIKVTPDERPTRHRSQMNSLYTKQPSQQRPPLYKGPSSKVFVIDRVTLYRHACMYDTFLPLDSRLWSLGIFHLLCLLCCFTDPVFHSQGPSQIERSKTGANFLLEDVYMQGNNLNFIGNNYDSLIYACINKHNRMMSYYSLGFVQ